MSRTSSAEEGRDSKNDKGPAPPRALEKVKPFRWQYPKLEKELKQGKSGAAGAGSDLMGEVKKIGEVSVLSAVVNAPDRSTLGEWAERYRDRLKSGVVILGSVLEDKVALVAVVVEGPDRQGFMPER